MQAAFKTGTLDAVRLLVSEGTNVKTPVVSWYGFVLDEAETAMAYLLDCSPDERPVYQEIVNFLRSNVGVEFLEALYSTSNLVVAPSPTLRYVGNEGNLTATVIELKLRPAHSANGSDEDGLSEYIYANHATSTLGRPLEPCLPSTTSSWQLVRGRDHVPADDDVKSLGLATRHACPTQTPTQLLHAFASRIPHTSDTNIA